MLKIANTIFKKFQAFGKRVSKVVNFLMLSLVYTFGIGATSIIAKLLRKRFLILKHRKQDSYWIEHDPTPKTVDELGRMV